VAELETLDVQGGEGEDGAESGGSAGGGREVAGADLRPFREPRRRTKRGMVLEKYPI
jgi:hypothetical protein